jgi:hypothetical protein
MTTPPPKAMWVIYHNNDYSKSIEKVRQPYIKVHRYLNEILTDEADTGAAGMMTDIIMQDVDGWGRQYKLWTDAEAAEWQARYDAATKPS